MSVMALPIHPPVDDEDAQDPATAARDRRNLRLGCATGAVPAIAVVICVRLTLARCLAPLVTSSAPPAGTRVPITGSIVFGRGGLEVIYSVHVPCRRPRLTVTESPTSVSLTLTETD